jgi:hypothetical protein
MTSNYSIGILQTSRDVEIIRLDKKNTVKSLRDQLFTLTAYDNDDGGFPILRPDSNEVGFRMVGYIGANELEHALSNLFYFLMKDRLNWYARHSSR